MHITDFFYGIHVSYILGPSGFRTECIASSADVLFEGRPMQKIYVLENQGPQGP